MRLDIMMLKTRSGEGRIVSTDDLTELQISEANVDDRIHVTAENYGYVLLPWELTTAKDLEREKQIRSRNHTKAVDQGDVKQKFLDECIDNDCDKPHEGAAVQGKEADNGDPAQGLPKGNV